MILTFFYTVWAGNRQEDAMAIPTDHKGHMDEVGVVAKTAFRPTILSANAKACERSRSQIGMTLLELIIAASILLILSSAALPVFRFTVTRQKEACERSCKTDPLAIMKN
jgi:prepilin-type N-terminal cleavage/methylation domain-containing protein